MASKSKLTAPPQWWKHLKQYKAIFWNKEKANAKKDIKEQIEEYKDDNENRH